MPFGAGPGTGMHNPVFTSSAFPGRQNGAQLLVTPVSPGRHAEVTAGVKTMAPRHWHRRQRRSRHRRSCEPSQ